MNEDQLKRYLKGDCTEQERKAVEHWLEADPSNLQMLEDLLPPLPADIRRDVVRRRILDTLLEERPSGRMLNMQAAWRVAAAVVLLAVSSYLLYTVITPAAPGVTRYATLTGEVKQIALDDSSHISLNGASFMEAPVQFAAHERRVTLEGEAFFDVAKDAKRPFIIRSGDVTVQVLGTSFNVRAYTHDNDVMVTVATGKVRVRLDRDGGAVQEIVLQPGQQAIVHKQARALDTLRVNPVQYMAWKDGYLKFQNVSLAEIIDGIERAYDISIDTGGSLDLHQRLTFNQRQRSAAETLTVLANLANFTYRFKDEHHVVIAPASRE